MCYHYYSISFYRLYNVPISLFMLLLFLILTIPNVAGDLRAIPSQPWNPVRKLYLGEWCSRLHPRGATDQRGVSGTASKALLLVHTANSHLPTYVPFLMLYVPWWGLNPGRWHARQMPIAQAHLLLCFYCLFFLLNFSSILSFPMPRILLLL